MLGISRNQSGSNDPWMSGRIYIALTILALLFAVGIAGLAIIFPSAIQTIGTVAIGVGGVVLGGMAVTVLVWNFVKMLKEFDLI